jgi:outer membrane lipoprotein-sorting protein
VKPAGTGERVGREVLRARAQPRQPAAGKPDLSIELELDAQYGIILRRAAFEDGNCVRLTEALDARFDEAIEPDRFAFDIPPDA